eukprot:15434271-Alexandrium_andersonii.AAC.1
MVGNCRVGRWSAAGRAFGRAGQQSQQLGLLSFVVGKGAPELDVPHPTVNALLVPEFAAIAANDGCALCDARAVRVLVRSQPRKCRC